MGIMGWVLLLVSYVLITNVIAKWVRDHAPVYLKLLFWAVRLALLIFIISLARTI